MIYHIYSVIRNPKMICNKCNLEQDISEYRKKSRICKSCERERSRLWKQTHKEKNSEITKNWKEANKEEVKEYNKNYNADNREHIQKRHEKRQKERIENEEGYKIYLCLLGRMSKFPKRVRGKKPLDLLGCSLSFLVEWLKFRFTDEMKIRNHGEIWHIDHVIPIITFNLQKQEEVDRCFHWTNLQPLLGIVNQEKADDISFHYIHTQELLVVSFIKLHKKSLTEDFFYTEKKYDKLKYIIDSNDQTNIVIY